MGQRGGTQDKLFYSFTLDDHVPQDHLLRGIDGVSDLGDLRRHLAPSYSHTGRPAIDPERMIRMLIVGHCVGIRSERRLCEEGHLNRACRWLCRLHREDAVPGHSTFSKNRPGRFRQRDGFRHLFEGVLRRCMSEGRVGSEGFAFDASVVKADANRARGVPGAEASVLQDTAASRAVREYLDALDRANPTGDDDDLDPPEARLDGQGQGHCSSRACRARSERKDGTPSGSESERDEQVKRYRRPQGHALLSERRPFTKPRDHITEEAVVIYRASQNDCAGCPMMQHCCPKEPARKIRRSVHEDSRHVARGLASTPPYPQSRRDRKTVEMLFAHLKRILKLDHLRLRGLSGAHDEFLLAASAQNLRRMAKMLCEQRQSAAAMPARKGFEHSRPRRSTNAMRSRCRLGFNPSSPTLPAP